MSSSVTSDGFQCDDLATIHADLQTAMRTIFGQDIDLDPDTMDGQTLGIYAESKADSDQLAQDVYSSWNPQTATGVALSRVVEYNGIRRIPGFPSQGTISCGGSVGTHIPIGSIVLCTVNNERYVTIQDGYIDSTGLIKLAVLSQNYGAIQGPAGTITEIVTPIFGWQTVTNELSVVLGRNEESDEELRIRRAASTATPAQSVPDSVYGAIANIPGVTEVRLYENYTPTTDANGLPPHSYSCVVQGGTDIEIATAIWNRASIGATQIGTTHVVVTDVQGFPHDVYFQRPAPVKIYLSISVHPLSGWGDQLINEMQLHIAEWTVTNWQIGDSIIYSRLYEPINEMPPVFSVTAMKVDKVTPPVGTVDIPIAFSSIATLAPVDVVITKV